MVGQRQVATLDDSQISTRSIVIYTHALIIPDELPLVLELIGPSVYVYRQHDLVERFVLDNLPDDYALYACKHYIMYPKIDARKHTWVNGIKLDGLVEGLFASAHRTAKNRARYLASLTDISSRSGTYSPEFSDFDPSVKP